MITFRIRLKKARKPTQPRLRFDCEKLRDPDVACTFQAMIGGKFAPLIELRDEGMGINIMINTFKDRFKIFKLVTLFNGSACSFF